MIENVLRQHQTIKLRRYSFNIFSHNLLLNISQCHLQNFMGKAINFIPFLWEGTGSFIKVWPLNPLSSTCIFSELSSVIFLCTSKENWFTDQDTMSMVFISFFYLSKWFITLKKFDDNFVRLLELSLKLLDRFMVKWFVILTFEFVGEILRH